MLVRWTNATFPVAGTRGLLGLPDGALLVVAPRRADGDGGVRLLCHRSDDAGRSWNVSGTVAMDTEPGADIGDGMLLRADAGTLYYCYRQNHYRGARQDTPDYSIRIAESPDAGKSWKPHSVVTAHTVRGASRRPSRGLWAPFLLEPAPGILQCYFDDEKTPFDQGFPGHQWLTMKTWNPGTRRWESPVVVSRARNPRHLSRDGMATVAALSPQRLVAAMEGVDPAPPHPNLLFLVTSEDGGRSWSWQTQDRRILYRPRRKNYMALCPQLSRLSNGTLACVFCTDEDRDQPGLSGTPPDRLQMSVKLILSEDQGRSWSAPQALTDSQRTYLPGLVEVKPGQLLATWLDFAAGGDQGRPGTF